MRNRPIPMPKRVSRHRRQMRRSALVNRAARSPIHHAWEAMALAAVFRGKIAASAIRRLLARVDLRRSDRLSCEWIRLAGRRILAVRVRGANCVTGMQWSIVLGMYSGPMDRRRPDVPHELVRGFSEDRHGDSYMSSRCRRRFLNGFVGRAV